MLKITAKPVPILMKSGIASAPHKNAKIQREAAELWRYWANRRLCWFVDREAAVVCLGATSLVIGLKNGYSTCHAIVDNWIR
jgi:hypothetical protein